MSETPMQTWEKFCTAMGSGWLKAAPSGGRVCIHGVQCVLAVAKLAKSRPDRTPDAGATPPLEPEATRAEQLLEVAHQRRGGSYPQRGVQLEGGDPVTADQPQMHLRGAGVTRQHLLERTDLVHGALPRGDADRQRPVR